jgi:hypothetical protein
MAKTLSLSPEQKRARAEQRLKHDHEFYARHCLVIIDKRGLPVPFVYNEPQRRGAQLLEAQRLAGKPMRGIDLKARQVGMSTRAQGMLIQRATQTPYHNAICAAHSGKTVGALFRMGKGMYVRLPAAVKPTIAQENNGAGRQFMIWGEPSLQLRRAGVVGLESSYTVATAKEAQDGRGLTFRTAHLSEVAFWDTEDMMLGVLNAVPDDPDSLIMVESTANGENFFQEFWQSAVDGSNGYIPMFTAWFEDVGYRKAFANDLERAAFERGSGVGPKRKDEPRLAELIRAYWGEHTDLDSDGLDRLVLEYLHWRLWAIDAKTRRSVVDFKQEYPSTPEEAFKSTGRRVFSVEFIEKVRERVARTDPVVPTPEVPGPAAGIFRGENFRTVSSQRNPGAKVLVPQAAIWVPQAKLTEDVPIPWRRWEAALPPGTVRDGQPVPSGQYIVGVDVMSGEDNEGALARHSIEVINHRTLKQVAEYDSQADPDQLAMECLLVALAYNRAWIGVEITGGWGLPVVRRLARDFHYPRVFMREQEDAQMDNFEDRLGWDTNAQTKPILIARGQELLRGELDGIRSRELVSQMSTYVMDERGRSAPQPGKLADRLIAWLIAQEVAARRPVKPDRGSGAIDTTGAAA